jgi:hypothetical protein
MIAEYTEYLDAVLSTVASQKCPCIVAGDMNIDLAKCGAIGNCIFY